MTVRIYRHALTGREVKVLDGTRTSRLVEADDNWSEVEAPKSPPPSPAKKSPAKPKEKPDGSGNASRRRGEARKGTDSK